MAMASKNSMAVLLLQNELKHLNRNPVHGFSAGLIDDNDVFHWRVTSEGPPNTLYHGGVFVLHISFPTSYPYQPPTVRFESEMWHPNVYPDGKVCISILHPPEDDPYGNEHASERWLPVHTVVTIMVCIVSMLSSPNDESPANVEASKQWREDRDEFQKKVRAIARKSQDSICSL